VVAAAEAASWMPRFMAKAEVCVCVCVCVCLGLRCTETRTKNEYICYPFN